MQYGNNGKVSYTHDEFDRLTGVRYDAETTDRYTYKYGANGHVAIVEDHHLGRTVQSEYDLAERPVQATHRDADGVFYRTTLHYDAQNRLDSFKENVGETLYTTTYAYDKDSRTTQVAYGDEKVEYVYDDLGRLTTRTTTNGAAYPTAYAYLPGAAENSTTSLVSQITHGSGDNALTYAYTYDSRGNITTETRNGETTTYHYDNLGQLVRVDDPHENATWVYTYDLGGNILSKAKYALNNLTSMPATTSFTYGDTNWKDKLTAVNGVAITYDAIGNPLNDGEWTYEWQAGRQLKKMSKSGVTVEFAYDHNGLRTQKKVTENGVTTITDYTLHGKLITHMTQGSDNLHFYYDANSRPAMVDFNGTKYTYVHNLQGDIIAIIDNAGTAVVEYSYDAWGRIIATKGSKSATFGKLNPFRYRGYVYDEETGLYYLRSRYYAPTRSRFVNADIFAQSNKDILSSNMFTYCQNIPIVQNDPDGFWTFGISLSFNLNVFLGISVSIGLVIDDDWNFDCQKSYAVPCVDDTVSMGLLDVGLGLTLQYTDRNTVKDLYGPGVTTGFSAGAIPFVGVDIISFSEASDPNAETNGFQVTLGGGLGIDAHIVQTQTVPYRGPCITVPKIKEKKFLRSPIARRIKREASRGKLHNKSALQ